MPLTIAGMAVPMVKIRFPLLNIFGVMWNYRSQTMSVFTP
jgi:hypothetical protein